MGWMLRNSGQDEVQARLIKALYKDSGIQNRFSVLKDFREGESSRSHWEAWASSSRMQIYRKEALDLGKKAVEGLFLEQPEFQNPTHLIWVSCTGLMAPGPEILLALALGLSPKTQRMAVNFMGCHGFFHALRYASGIVAGQPEARVVVVCAELCTLHFRPQFSQDQWLANALFGDGAAAIGISAARPESRLTCHEQIQFLEPEGIGSMAWDLGEAGFEMKLSRDLPGQVEKRLLEVVACFGPDFDLRNQKHWVVHPGGKRILDGIQRGFQLPEAALSNSRKALAEVGNVSSAAVLFALRNFLESQAGAGEGILLGVGPGISIEAARFTYSTTRCSGFLPGSFLFLYRPGPKAGSLFYPTPPACPGSRILSFLAGKRYPSS